MRVVKYNTEADHCCVTLSSHLYVEGGESFFPFYIPKHCLCFFWQEPIITMCVNRFVLAYLADC